MESLIFHGDAFSEYYLTQLVWEESKLQPFLGTESAQSSYRRAAAEISRAQRALRAREQARSTRTLLLNPFCDILGWTLGEEDTVETTEGTEDAGAPLITDGEMLPIRVRAIGPDAPLDLPPTGIHRRFAPTLSMVRVLEESKLTWGMLLNAYELRLIRRAEGFIASHIGFDLTAIAEGSQAGFTAWKLLWGLLRADALQAEPLILERVVTLGREHQEKVGKDLGRQVQEAVVAFVQGIVSHPANQEKLPQPITVEYLRELYAQALRVLYRVLFALYAEARNLLPLDLPTYRDGYALTRLARLATTPATDPRRRSDQTGRFLEWSLRALFDLLRRGANLGPEGRIPAYGGALFDHSGTALVESYVWGDATVAHVLEKLTLVPRQGMGLVRLSYRELDVEQLGSIYENLLEQTLAIAHEPMWRIRLDDRELVVTAAERHRLAERRGEIVQDELLEAPLEEGELDGEETVQDVLEENEEGEEEESEDTAPRSRKPIRVLAEVPVGTVYLKAGMGRKQSGSYYTSRAFVEFLVREALDPLAEGKSPEEILALKAVDPAMGSGHFLVGACRRLAEHLLAAYRGQYETIRETNPDAPQEDIFLEGNIHPEVARCWDNEDRALAACRLLVAGNCLYGVDKNPLAVDLARVSLWLATAAVDHPLTFLDHRLRVGDSLLGLPVEEILKPYEQPTHGRRRRRKKASAPVLHSGYEENTPGLFAPSMQQLRERLRRAFRHLATIRELMDEAPGDFAGQRAAFEAMRGELASVWALHEIRIGRTFLPVEPHSTHASIIDEWLRAIAAGLPIPEEAQSAAEPARAQGQDFGAFCWPLAFPEVFFDADGKLLQNPGFSAIIGNPPWDKVKPNERECFAEFDPTVWDVQGQERKGLIARLRGENPEADTAWVKHESAMKALSVILLDGGIYHYQVAEVEGKKTGGDPDTFKFFTERAYQMLRSSGRAGIIVPMGIQGSLGCTGLRRLLLDHCQLSVMCKLDNERFIFPGVHHSQKFNLLVFVKGERTEIIEAAFLSWETADVLTHFRSDPRYLKIDADLYKELSPEQYTFVTLHDQTEVELLRRIYRQLPRLGEHRENTWNVSFVREFDMTNDSYLFHDAARLKEMGATLYGRRPSPTEAAAGALFEQSDGGEFWTTPKADWYDAQPERFVRVERWVDSRGRVHFADEIPEDRVKYRLAGYALVHERDERTALPVRPGETYVPLYEGRLVHQFDHCREAYVSGSGRRAKWEGLDWGEKEIVPHYFMAMTDFQTQHDQRQIFRAGFCDVTGQTNERSALCTIIPALTPCGNSVPTAIGDQGVLGSLLFTALLNSFAADFLLRKTVSNHLNFFILQSLVLPRIEFVNEAAHPILKCATHLCCTTPELAGLWEEMAHYSPEEFLLPWSRELACLDIRERAKLRAEIDARVAQLYGLTTHEYARILTTFLLLDQDQPPLPGDIFIRVTNKGERVIPRSYITRDLALLTYCELMNESPPTNIVSFFADAGVDIDRQTGPIRDLRERVEEVTRRGAVAYIPSTRKSWSPEGPFLPPDLPLEIARNGHKEYHKWIVEDPRILGGEPTLVGTRIAVRLVADLLNKGWTFRQIVESYPHLSNEQVAIAWRWSQLQ